MGALAVAFGYSHYWLANIIKDEADSITIKDAIVAIPTGQGQLGFAPWIPILSKSAIEVTFDKKFVVFIAEADDAVVEQYNTMFGNVITPKQKIIV